MAFKDEVGSLDRIATALEGIEQAEGAGIPTPTADDAGKVLMVDAEGKWTLALVLPAATDEDEGKALVVNSEGAWSKGDTVIPELPDVTAPTDSGKILMVTEYGHWAPVSMPSQPPASTDGGEGK